MQKVIAVNILLALSLLGITAAHNCAVRSYATKLVLACDPNEIYIKWPNYEDASTYHQCQGVGKSQLIACPAGQVFAHAKQGCVTCDRYVPAVECRSLPTQRPPVCVNIDGSGQNTSAPEATHPTPNYPNSTPSEGGGGNSGTDDPNGNNTTDDPNGNNTTDDPNGNNTTDDANGNNTTDDPNGINTTDDPNGNNSNEGFPGPPSPPSVTNDPNVPTPPTAPPDFNATPPHVG